LGVISAITSTHAKESLTRRPLLPRSDEFCQSVLSKFVSDFDLGGLGFDDALRKFLAAFRLPGEAQKIDRIMHAYKNQVATPCSMNAFCLCSIFPRRGAKCITEEGTCLLLSSRADPWGASCLPCMYTSSYISIPLLLSRAVQQAQSKLVPRSRYGLGSRL
jgi:hypothetical protein